MAWVVEVKHLKKRSKFRKGIGICNIQGFFSDFPGRILKSRDMKVKSFVKSFDLER
jgi:hypothetical protein